MFKKFAFTIVAILALLSCENPIQAGLGRKVDITVPVITMVEPQNVGDRIKGKFDLKINATDDIGVTKVQVAVTKAADGSLLPEPWEWKNAVLDHTGGLWNYQVDTTLYPDGDLPVMIRAEDATGKEVRFEGMYSSKNNPPEIELQIPAVPADPARRMELVTGGVMIGIAKDLWGVAPGYPKIQFWPVSDGENPANPYAWQLMDTYAARPADEWAAAGSGKTALEFQFYAVDRSAGSGDPSLTVNDMPSLRPGTYRFRFQVKDVDETGGLTVYPATGYYEVDVIAVRELPIITVTARDENNAPLAGQYHREPFYIAADVTHTTGIYRATIEVQKEGEGQSVVLARAIYSPNKETGSGVNTTMTRQLATYLIYPGKDYEHTDVDDKDNDYGAAASYPFTDGIYTFTIYATSFQTSYARQNLTVYIDTTPPEMSITRVQPAVETLNPGAGGGLDEYTVNGFIAADISSFDANNIGVYLPNPAAPDISYREIKYLIKNDYSAAADPRTLYNDPGAQYFDHPTAPVYTRPGSTASVIIDTTHSSIAPGGADYYKPKNKYLHFIAKDRAGNYGFTAALLKVDQNTDKPGINITGFDLSLRSAKELAESPNPNKLLDADRMISGTFTDDDGVRVDNVQFKIYQDNAAGVPQPIEAKIAVTKDNLTVLNNGRTVNFNVKLPPAPEPGNSSDASHLADGTYSLEIEIRDSFAAKNALKLNVKPSIADLAEEILNTTEPGDPKRKIYFVLDTQPPVLIETAVGDTTNAPHLTAGRFSLKGTVSDINGLRSLRITQTKVGVDGAKLVFEKDNYNAAKNADWILNSLPLTEPNSPLLPGTFTYEITAMDVAQRTTNLTRRVVVDTEKPVLTIAQPAQLAPNAWVDGSIVVVKGTETDNYRTGPVFYRIEKASSPVTVEFKASLAEYRGDTDGDGVSDIDTGWKELTVLEKEWSHSVNFQEGNAPLGEGIFHLYMAAFDAAGNQSNNAGSVRAFGVDYNMPHMDNWAAPAIQEIAGAYYAKGPYTLSFDACDSNALYAGGSPASVQVKATSNGVAHNLTEGSHSELGGYTLTIDRSDASNRTWPVTLALTNPAEKSVAYEFIITDASGSQNTLDNHPGADADAHKRIMVRTDKSGPTLSVAEPVTGYTIAGNSLQSAGVATDTGIPELVPVYYRVTNGTGTVTEPATRAAAAADPAWTLATADASWNTPITLDAGVAGEGEKRIHFVAYDQLDNSTLASRAFYVDLAPPHIQTWTGDIDDKQPAINLFGVDNFSFTFVAQDTNALQGVTITQDGIPLTADGNSHNDTAGSYRITRTVLNPQNWQYAAVLSGQPDGNYVYGIEIRDVTNKQNLANNDPVPANAYKNFNVRVDTTGPEVEITYPINDPLVRAKTLIAYGTAKDATMDDMKVWYKVDNSAAIAQPNPANPALAGWKEATGTSSWGLEEDLSAKPEGYLWLHVIAYDKLGTAGSMYTERFSVDYSPPAILDFAFTGGIMPVSDGAVICAEGAYSFKFKAQDSNALSSVVVARGGTELVNATAALNSGTGGYDYVGTGSGSGAGWTYTVTPNGANTEWTVAITLTGQNQGNYPYAITIIDIAGQQNTLDNNTPGDASPDTDDDHKTFALRVDTKGPELTVDNPVNAVDISGSVINVNGTAADLTANGLSVWFKVDAAPSASTPADRTAATGDGWIETLGTTIWSKSDVSLIAVGEGTRYVHFVGFDKLGNVGPVTDREIFYDAYPPYMKDWAATDVVDIKGSYYAKGAYTLSFNAYDSNALYTGGSPASVRVRATSNNVVYDLSTGAHSELGGYTLTINQADTTTWTWPVTLTLDGPDNGNISYEFIIRDARGKENALENQPGADGDAHKKIVVRTDKQGPNLSVAEPVTGHTITGASLQISGVALDTGIPELVPVYYRVTNGAGGVTEPATRAAAAADPAWTLATADASWNGGITLGAGLDGEGEKRIHFAAYDQLDNSTLVSREFYVDSAAPHIKTWTSGDIAGVSNLIRKKDFAFTFTAYDSNALQSVTITRGGKPLTADGASHTDAVGSYTITKAAPSNDQNWEYIASFTNQTDGNYVYGIEIRDIAGKINPDDNAPDSAKKYKTFNVRIDTAGPVLAFTEPADDSTVGGSTITIGGTAEDALTPTGVTVWYVINGSNTIANPSSPPSGDPLVLAGWNRADGSADWHKSADIGGAVEGLLYVHAVAYDQLGNRSNLVHKRFYVDISPPVIDGFSFTGVTSDSGVNFAGAGYQFKFKAKDTNALKSVKVSRGGTALFTATGATPSGTGTNYTYTVVVDSAKEWTVTVNFTSQADGNYAFSVEVKDIAGRENALDNSTATVATDDYKTFGVRVDTKGPVLAIVDPAENISASGSKLFISGTADDALTMDNVRVFYIIDSASGASAPADMAAAIVNWKEAPGGAIWSANADLASGSEGARYLHVIAYDKQGNASGIVPVHRKFFVDVNPPQILAWDDTASTGINFSSTPYYAGKSYTIKFNAHDSNTLAGGAPASSQSLVKITRNGVELPVGNYGDYDLTIVKTDPQTWPVTLAMKNQADGNYSYAIEIRDATGKENTLDNNTLAPDDDRKGFTIVVDSTPPNTSLTMAPAMISNEGQDFVLTTPGLLRSDNVNGVIQFSATAMDPSGLEGVKWFIIPDSPSPPFDPSVNAQSLYGDSRGTLFDPNSYTALKDTAGLTPGRYSLYILAKDKAGNVGYNSSSSCVFYADQRTDRPVTVLTNLSKDGSNDPVVSSGFILRGTVKDDDGVDTGSLKINLYDGANWYNGSSWNSSSPVDLAIPAGSIAGSGREVGFSYTLPAGMIDGPDHKVVVKAADLPSDKTGSGDSSYNATNAAKTSSTEMTFVLDVTAPAIIVSDAVDSTYKAAAGITGTLTEKHIDVFRLRIDAEEYVNYIANPDSNAGPLVLTSWNSTTGLGTWTYKLPIVGPPPLSVGLHTLTLEAVDKAGLATTVLWRFYVDNTGPVISFRIDETPYPTWGTAPPAEMNILREGGLALRGDFRDDFSAVFTDSFEYRFDDQSSWTTTTSTTASIANPGRNPSWTLFLENLPAPISGVMPDGPHRVQIRVKDALANTTESIWVGFRVDTADPDLSNILPAEANAVFGNGADPVFTLKGTAADANLSSVTLTLNGAVNYPVTVPPGATSVNFSHPVTATVFSPLVEGANRFTITAVDAAGRSKTVEWNFIKDTVPPKIEWSNLNNKTGNDSSMFQDSANLKIIGVARDANGVHTLTSAIDKWNGSTWVTMESAFDLKPGDEAVKNWIKDVSTLTGSLIPPLDGLYRITVNATDRGGNAATPQTQEFRVDLAMPAVAIDAGGTYALKPFYNGKATGSGPIVVSGIASDANGITGVTAALSGSLAPAWAKAAVSYNAGTKAWQVTIPHVNPGNSSETLPQGGYTLNVIATDGAGRTNSAYGTFTFDSVDPLSTIDLPVRYGRVTGSVSIRGSNNDTGSGVDKMYYQFTKEDTDQNKWKEVIIRSPPTDWSGGLYSWNFTFTSSGCIGTSYGREVSYDGNTGTVTAATGTGLWETPFKVKVVDQAGNEKIINDYFLLLDQFGDIPRIEISNPASGSILGGRVYISGTANDNNYINRIQYRVKPKPSLQPDEWNGINWTDGGLAGFLTGSGIGPSVTWQFDINGLGEYNPGPGEGIRAVLVQARAVDAPQGYPNDLNGAFSDPVSVLIYFDAGVPRIGSERVANNVAGPIPILTPMTDANSAAYVDGLQVARKFVFEASIQDDSGLETIQYWKDGVLNGPNALGTSEVVAPDIKTAGSFIVGRKYMIDSVGSTIWTNIGATSNTHGATFTATGIGSGSGTAYEATAAGEFVYRLRFMIPSNELAAYTDKTGHFTINIMALDNSSPQLRADRSYTLQVDNFYPFGTYTSPNMAAGWHNLRGTARDFNSASGPIQGLDKVVVYFSRGGTFIPLHEPGSTVGPDGNPWNPTTQAVRKASDGSLATVTFPGDKYSGITIDRDEQGAGKDQDADGYEEAWYDNGADKIWSARFNTLQLKDGPVTVHYVIFDKAGNAAYYEYTVFIKNHAPVIKSATLGTDIFGDKSIGGTRLYTTGYFTNPAFVARNQRLSFNVAKIDGNGAAHYRITPVTQQQVEAAAVLAGEIYTIAAAGSTDWVAIGAASNTVGTTFVATSNGNGSGQAYKYTPVSGAAVKSGDVNSGGGNETGNVIFSGTDFNNIPDAANAYFLIKIWDTTVSGGSETQQLSDMIVVRARIENTDTEAPTSRLYDLSPYAKNQSRYDIVTTLGNAGPGGIGEDQNMRFGGLYMENNAISGHVEPRGKTANTNSIFLENGVSSTFNLDTVSGKVLLRGYARDNQRISEIQVQFGSAAAIPIIRTNSSPAETSAGHYRALEPVSTAGVRAWVYDDLSLDEHLVEWAYEWDTQATTGMATVGTIVVKAIARDAKIGNYSTSPYGLTPNSNVTIDQGPGTAAPPAANNVNYNAISMTAAPYIASLNRGGGYNTTRSKQGWNSFRRSSGTSALEANEEVIVNGFNLSLGGGTGSAVTIKGAAMTLVSQSVARVTFNLPNTAQTGAFELTVNGAANRAVNNMNDNRNTWNKEASATVEGSALWNDDRNVHVWQTNNTGSGATATANRGYFEGSRNPVHPAMTKHPTTGVLHASWSNYENVNLNRGANNAASAEIFKSYDPPEHTDIHFGPNGAGANTSPTIAYYLNLWGGGNWNVTSVGGMDVYDDKADANYAGGGNAYVAESLTHDQILAHFENPRVVSSGDAIHLSYYDTDTKSLKYWYNTKGVNVSSVNYTSSSYNVSLGNVSYANNRWINLDGGFDGNDMYRSNRVLGYISGGTAGNNGNVAGDSAHRGPANGDTGASPLAGEFSAIDLTSNGYPVIAYYDATNQTVKLAYANAAIPLTVANWKRQNVLQSSDPNYTFSGRYVSMRIDTRSGMQNRIHIVFYRTSSGDLIYATGTQAAAGGAYTFEPSVIIDSVGNVGKWADLSLDANGNPWVSYADSSWFDSFDAVKMAYCLTSTSATGAVNTSVTTGLGNPNNWEVITMPTIYSIVDKRISLENWNNVGTGTNQQFWSAAIGYASSDFFRIGYYIKP